MHKTQKSALWATNTAPLRLNRPVRLGFVGGGLDSFIGETHRIAARMDGHFDICAAALSSQADRSREQGVALGLDAQRSYASWQDMIVQEALREDGIDAIAVLTPNDSHFNICMAALDAGLHVMCEKPITNDLRSAQALQNKVQETGLEFCVAYCYSGFPMVRQAQFMVQTGQLGTIRQIHLQYIQGNLANPDLPLDAWRLDPAKGGESLVLLDIGTHAFHLGSYISGLTLSQVFADLGSGITGRQVHDYVGALLRYEGGAKGSLWVTNAAAGSEHGLSIRIHGDLGGLEWHQEVPNRLIHRQINGFEQIITRRKDEAVSEPARLSTRIAIGHPEGYLEAFANLYRELASAIAKNQSLQSQLFPAIAQGVEGLVFVEAAVQSSKKGAWVSIK